MHPRHRGSSRAGWQHTHKGGGGFLQCSSALLPSDGAARPSHGQHGRRAPAASYRPCAAATTSPVMRRSAVRDRHRIQAAAALQAQPGIPQAAVEEQRWFPGPQEAAATGLLVTPVLFSRSLLPHTTFSPSFLKKMHR